MTTQAEIDKAFQDAREVERAFDFVRRYGGTPCWECKGRQTVGTIIQSVVIASCTSCGGATRIGKLVNLWSPGTGPQEGQPILRAAPERLNSRTRRNGTA